MDIRSLTLASYLDLVASKEISPGEVCDAITKAISTENSQFNIYLALNTNLHKESESCKDLPLRGAPLAVKDNFLTVGMTTTASSNVLEHFRPPYESTVTKRLAHAGASIIGKTNMDAWAHGSSTETSDFGVTKNPRNAKHLPGGSSGGSAAAVAADLCIAAIGSETAGSIRQPAAWCGIVGLKPTYGRVSRAGVVAMGSSLDSPGPMTKTVKDAAILLSHIAGQDPYDGTTSPQAVPNFSSFINTEDQLGNKPLAGLRIGVAYNDFEQLPKETKLAMEKAAKVFEELGAQVTFITTSEQLEDGKILTPRYAIGLYTIIQRSEVSSNLGRYDGIRYGHDRSSFGEEAKRRIMLGTFTLSKGYADKYYLKGQQIRTLFVQNYANLFSMYDVLISPSSPHFALQLGATKDNPMFGELEDMLVEHSSVTGNPGINVPLARHDTLNLYLGLNITAPMWQEGMAIKVAHAFTRSSTYEKAGENDIQYRVFSGTQESEVTDYIESVL